MVDSDCKLFTHNDLVSTGHLHLQCQSFTWNIHVVWNYSGMYRQMFVHDETLLQIRKKWFLCWHNLIFQRTWNACSCLCKRCLPSVGGRDCCSQAADVDRLVGIHNLWCCFLVTCSINVVPLPPSLLSVFVDEFCFVPHHLKGVSVECSEKWFFHFHDHIMHVCSNLFFYIIHLFTNNHRNVSFEFKINKLLCALQSWSCDATEQNCQIN